MFSKRIVALVAAGLIGWAGLQAATTTKKKKPAAHPAHAASSKKSPKKRPATAHAVARPKTRTNWRAGQTAPTPDRYKEIQSALAQKGYLHGDATGVWDDNSADALRRFQHDQNLDASGKLDSLSIIALGLGPKY